jgi:hypothetical protein
MCIGMGWRVRCWEGVVLRAVVVVVVMMVVMVVWRGVGRMGARVVWVV